MFLNHVLAFLPCLVEDVRLKGLNYNKQRNTKPRLIREVVIEREGPNCTLLAIFWGLSGKNVNFQTFIVAFKCLSMPWSQMCLRTTWCKNSAKDVALDFLLLPVYNPHFVITHLGHLALGYLNFCFALVGRYSFQIVHSTTVSTYLHHSITVFLTAFLQCLCYFVYCLSYDSHLTGTLCISNLKAAPAHYYIQFLFSAV